MKNRIQIIHLNEHVGKSVTVAGFVQTIRDQSKIAFIILRDITGTVQIVVMKKDLGDIIESISIESVLKIVGQYDPSEQAFGAVVSNKDQAVEHIKTELSLLDANGKAKPPYILFISNAVDEASGNGRKQARANVARNFRFIVENEEIAQAVKDGIIVPIPVIITNRSRTIIEVPNLAL